MKTNSWEVEIDDLSYRYPDGTQGLSNINLRIRKGESVAILGPNGAGKSTLILTLPGLISGTGSVTVAGIRLNQESVRDVRRKVGIIFQNPDDQLFCPTVYDDIAFGPRNMGFSAEEIDRRVKSAIRSMGLSGYEGRSSHHLSFGEKKRASIATILTMDPSVIAFDEPSANLDPEGVHELKKVIKSIAKTKIIVTHDIVLAGELATRGVVMRSGIIVEDTPIKKLLSNKSRLKELKLLFSA